MANSANRFYSVSEPKVVQVVNVQDGAVATGTTTMPWDDTIPQNTEGDEYMSLAITPTSATNKLKIDVVISLSNTQAGGRMQIALFKDSTVNALAALSNSMNDTADSTETYNFTHYMVAGTTSEITFKVRAGKKDASTTTFNGEGGSRYMGGVMASSITISEIAV